MRNKDDLIEVMMNKVEKLKRRRIREIKITNKIKIDKMKSYQIFQKVVKKKVAGKDARGSTRTRCCSCCRDCTCLPERKLG